MDYGLKIFQNYGAKPPKLGEEPKLLTVTLLLPRLAIEYYFYRLILAFTSERFTWYSKFLANRTIITKISFFKFTKFTIFNNIVEIFKFHFFYF